jgi:hypothetical protein
MLFNNAVSNAGVSRVKQDERNGFEYHPTVLVRVVTKIKLRWFDDKIWPRCEILKFCPRGRRFSSGT